jgi:6-phosphogluconolactonase
MARNVVKLSLGILFCSLTACVAWADGAVYAMTNAIGNNQVLVFHRATNGNLTPTPVQTIATGGGGSGLQLSAVDSLGSAGSMQLDGERKLLFVANTESAAGNNGMGSYNSDCNQGTITSFLVASDGTLTFADRIFSRGLFPNSLTVKTQRRGRGDLLYVLNAGGGATACNEQPATASQPNITGFTVDSAGNMTPIGAVQTIEPGPSAGTGQNCPDAAGFATLTGAPAADFGCGLNPPAFPRSAAQVRFTPKGNQLIVTVKGTNTIYVFPVDESGVAGNPNITQPSGPALPTFFAFTFDTNEHLLIAETFGAATSIPMGAAGAVSSFDVTRNGDLGSISSHVGDGGTAACWIVLEPATGMYAYVSNNLSASISSYSVASNGQVTLLSANAANPPGPNDLAAVEEGGVSFLYTIASGSGAVLAYQINVTTGALSGLTGSNVFPGYPGTSYPQGIAAF